MNEPAIERALRICYAHVVLDGGACGFAFFDADGLALAVVGAFPAALLDSLRVFARGARPHSNRRPGRPWNPRLFLTFVDGAVAAIYTRRRRGSFAVARDLVRDRGADLRDAVRRLRAGRPPTGGAGPAPLALLIPFETGAAPEWHH